MFRLIIKRFCTANNSMANLAKLADVDIDDHGVFKYILIQAKEGDSKKLIVRGYKSCKFHANIFDKVEEEESANGCIKFECPGGGRISHDSEKKHINVYGYSQGFGRADHTKAVELLKKKYPNYKIDWSNEGY